MAISNIRFTANPTNGPDPHDAIASHAVPGFAKVINIVDNSWARQPFVDRFDAMQLEISARSAIMSRKPIKLVSLAAALVALSGTVALSPPTADAKARNPGKSDDATSPREDVPPNVFMTAGKDLLGMIVKKGADGIVTADHYSHSSHSSHASHSSHYSGR